MPVYGFSDSWTDEIAAESGKAEYQNATITLLDYSLVVEGEYDLETGEQTFTGDPEVWDGQARIIGVRWGVNRENSDFGNSMTISSLRVQIPKNAVGRMKRGVQMRVDTCTDNPSLVSRVYTLTSDLQGSNAATRTFEFSLDGDAVVADD